MGWGTDPGLGYLQKSQKKRGDKEAGIGYSMGGQQDIRPVAVCSPVA